MQDLAGTVWGRFQIMEERGRGGMAVVYKAYDGVLQRTVALKVLLSMLAANQEFTDRFRREAITAANLRHPNIVVIYDVGSHQNFQYIVMEYLEGPTLQQEIQARGILPMERCLHLLGQLAGALDYAHRQGLVHRDVKPANVIIGSRDHVTLTDFGLVKAVRTTKITGEGSAIGTLKYMSPEQAAGKELDSRSDVYSLGVVVYEMLTGESPFTGTTPFQTLQELMHKPPPPFSAHRAAVPANVERVVFQALAKDPNRRFGTAGEFVRAMTKAAGLQKPAQQRSDTDAIARNVALLLLGADGREFPVYAGHSSVGRDVSNDIIIPNQQISRHHARIRCRGHSCTVMDLQSTNGTSINSVPIPPGAPRPLRPGDVLGFGPVNLLVVAPSTKLPGDSNTAVMQYPDEYRSQ